VKRVEGLLDGHHLLGLFVDGFSDDSVGALAELLDNLELQHDVRLKFITHKRNSNNFIALSAFGLINSENTNFLSRAGFYNIKADCES